MSDLNRLINEQKKLVSALDDVVPDPPAAHEPPTPIGVKKPRPPEVVAVDDAPDPVAKEPKPKEAPFRKPGYFRGALDRILPTAEKIKVYKTDEMGSKHFVRSYSPKDLDRASDIEEFIQRFLVPVLGPGEYEVALINSKGEETRSVPIPMLDPARLGLSGTAGTPATGDQATMQTVKMLLDRVKELEAKPPEKTATVMDRLTEMKAMSEMFGAKGGDMNPMLMMMLMKDQQPAAPSREIAEIKAVLGELRASISSRSNLPPPLPMPSEPAIDVVALAKMITEANKPAFSLQDIVTLARPPVQHGEAMGFKEILALLPTIKSLLGGDQIVALQHKLDAMQAPAASRTLRDSLEEFKVIQGLVQSGQQPAPEGETFWGFLNNVVMNFPASAEAMGNMMARIRASEKAELPPSRDTSGASGQLDFPPGFDAMAKKIADGSDDAAKIEATLKAFQFLGKHGAWRSYLSKVVKLAQRAKSGDAEAKKEALSFVKSFLAGLVDGKFLTQPIASQTEIAFDRHFDRVLDVIVGAK